MRQFLSVTLCTYNGEKFLGEQLKSIASQICPPDELIICDDRSDDNTVNIAKTFATKSIFPVYLFVNDERQGVVRNFEKAIRLCKGDIIALSDQDDVWMPEKLAIIKKTFQENPDAHYVFSDAFVVDGNLRSLGYTVWQQNQFTIPQRQKFKKGFQAQALLKIGSAIAGCTMAFRSKFPNWVLPFPFELKDGYHDGWIVLLLSFAGYKGVFIERPLIKYRQHCLQSSGGIRTGFERIRKIYSTKEEIFEQIQQLYIAALNRLNSAGQLTEEKKHLFEAKIRHLGIRGLIWKFPRYRRLPFVIRELVSGRYYQFSRGWESAVRDILI